MRAIVRHYPKVQLLRLPACDHEAKRVADRALAGLKEKRPYAFSLARFGFVWANLRSLDHPHAETWSRALFPIAAVIGWVLGRGRTTCSGFVYEVLDDCGLASRLPLRFDRALPTSQLGAPRWRHAGWRSHLCSPADFWCAFPSDERFVLQTAPVMSRTGESLAVAS